MLGTQLGIALGIVLGILLGLELHIIRLELGIEDGPTVSLTMVVVGPYVGSWPDIGIVDGTKLLGAIVVTVAGTGCCF